MTGQTFGRTGHPTHWTVCRIPYGEACGAVATCRVAPGEPMQVLSSIAIEKRRVRCLTHAIGLADWDAIEAERAQYEIEQREQAERTAREATQPARRIVQRVARPGARLQSFAALSDVASSVFDAKAAAAGRDE